MKKFKILVMSSVAIIAIPIIIIVALFICYILDPDDVDVCLDAGYCKEGLTLNDKGETFIVNKDSCIKHKGLWKDGFCSFRH